MTNAEKEKLVREAIAAKCASVPKIGKAHASRSFLSDENEFIEAHCETNIASGELEVKTLIIELIGLEDTEGGCQGCPAFVLTYRLHLFHGFVESRPDDSNSTFDFYFCLMNLRDLFLDDGALNLGAKIENEPLTVETAPRVGDDEGYTEAYGHIVDFNLRVEVIPDCS